MDLRFENHAEFDEAAYRSVAEFLALRENEDGEPRNDASLRLCLHAAQAQFETRAGFQLMGCDAIVRGEIAFPMVLPLNAVLPAQLVFVKSKGQNHSLSKFNLTKENDHWLLESDWGQMADAQILIRSGFEKWADIPADIQMLILRLSAYYYQSKSGAKMDWPKELDEQILQMKTLRLGFANE